MSAQHAQNGRQPISPRQIKIIHTLKSILVMDEESYRAMLREFAGVASSKSLSWRQADELIADMQGKAGNVSPENAEKRTRHGKLADRPGMATPPQLRKIEAMWSEVTRAEDPESQAKGLRSFLERIAKVSSLRFLDMDGAKKMITALGAMIERRKII
jgi:phage gp16-like protein